jgi:hypothetical protein
MVIKDRVRAELHNDDCLLSFWKSVSLYESANLFVLVTLQYSTDSLDHHGSALGDVLYSRSRSLGRDYSSVDDGGRDNAVARLRELASLGGSNLVLGIGIWSKTFSRTRAIARVAIEDCTLE